MLNYDRVYTSIEKAIDRFELPKPGVFKKGYIDRTSLTYYNKEQVGSYKLLWIYFY